MRRGRRPLRSAETLSAAIEIAIARSALDTKLWSVMSTSMRARTRHALYQSCVRRDSRGSSTIEVAFQNALAIAQRGETRRDAASGVQRGSGKVGRGLSIVGGASAILTGAEVLALANDPDVGYVSVDEAITATFDPVDGAALASSPGILEVGAPAAWRQLGVT